MRKLSGKGGTRRAFLKKTALCLAAAMGGLELGRVWTLSEEKKPVQKEVDLSSHSDDAVTPSVPREAPKQAEPTQSTRQQIDDPESVRKPGSYLATSGESLCVMAGTITISAAVRKITGKKIGLPPEDVKELEKMPYWQLVGRGCLLGPMAEEALFRGAPSFLLGAKGVRWGTGLFSSAVFALLHSPELKTLPVPQFLLGAFNWYKMRTRGFGHAFVAHATVNTIVMHTVQLERYTKFRKTKSPVAGEKTQPPKSNVDLMAQ